MRIAARSRRRRVVLSVIALAVVVSAAALVLDPAFVCRAVTNIVVVDDPLRPADFIYVLNGRIEPRVDQAARLYRAGLGPRILLARTREMAHRPDQPLSHLIADEIVARGVPARAVQVVPFEGGVVDTRDEARALRRQLEREPARSVIVVTMDYHTGRARRTIRQELRGLDVRLAMAAAPSSGRIRPGNWWKSEQGRRVYLGELAKQAATILLGFSPLR